MPVRDWEKAGRHVRTREISPPHSIDCSAEQTLSILASYLRRLVRDEVSAVLSELLPRVANHPDARAGSVDAPSTSQGFITLDQAEERVHRSGRTISRWRKDGLLTYGARNNLIDPRELDAFVRQQKGKVRAVRSDEERATSIMIRARKRKAG